jgi:hypothetical protein
MWLKNKVLEIDERKDEDGKDRSFVIPGPFKPETSTAPAAAYSDDE